MSVARAWVTDHERFSDAEWIERFRAEGFTVDGEPAELPAEPLTLYRGASLSRHRGLSWTTSQGVAMRFATSEGQRHHMWRLWLIEQCPPDAMLAMWHGRYEGEVIIDPAELPIREWTNAEIDACPPMQRSEDYGVASPVPHWQSIITPKHRSTII